MAREKECYRDNLVRIMEQFPEHPELIPLQPLSKWLGVHPERLKADRKFPLKKISGRYFAPVVLLARWLS